jgi:hypothetical protein
MSSWAKPVNQKLKIPEKLVIVHNNSGFFSCCSVRLDKIVQFYNKYKQLPSLVDSSEQFMWYKPTGRETESITADYFKESDSTIKFTGQIQYENWYQYLDYKTINFKMLSPFINKYFSPANDIRTFVEILEAKYCIDYKNLGVLFYRGNDKVTETANAPYQDYLDRARKIQAENPNVRFLVQSDETEFIETMMSKLLYPTFFMGDEIRHIKKSINTVDKVWTRDENYKFSQLYLAITIIMSKAKYIICGSGNCSIWICLYRGNTDGVQQFLKTAWTSA